MLRSFESNIAKKRLFAKSDKLLLAISGGVDSVVLAHLLEKGKYRFGLAHFNFKLRGKDSEADEKFCRKLADELGVEIHVKRGDAASYAKKKGTSVQMAAREMRYEWFEALVVKEEYDHILTAHHGDDAIETFFINLSRGTGINGLKGIQESNGKVRRPLLIFPKTEIEAYAKSRKLKFRLDRSNLEEKYQRNFIRRRVVPLFRQFNPNFDETMLSNIERLREEAEALNGFFEKKSARLFRGGSEKRCADRKQLAKEGALVSLLHNFLGPFGFNESQCRDIKMAVIKGAGGKTFYRGDFAVVTTKEQLCVSLIKADFKDIKIKSIQELKDLNIIKVGELKRFQKPRRGELLIEEEALRFPLTIRAVKKGDRFQPFGMKGFKLLSDFLKDEGVDRLERKQVKLLVDAGERIVWVMGYRGDERFRVNEGRKRILKISVHE